MLKKIESFLLTLPLALGISSITLPAKPVHAATQTATVNINTTTSTTIQKGMSGINLEWAGIDMIHPLCNESGFGRL